MTRYLAVLPLLAAITCMPISPSHARTPAHHESPAYLEEGSHGAWTRCAAHIETGRIMERCGTLNDITVCKERNGQLWGTVWQGRHAEVYRAPPKREPLDVGTGIVETSLVSARYASNGAEYLCEVYVVGERLVVGWNRK